MKNKQLVNPADSESCIKMLEAIYNYRNQEMVAIGLQIRQHIREGKLEAMNLAVQSRKKK